MIRSLLITLVTSLSFFALPSIEARTWTQAATNRTIDAEMVKVDRDNVVLRLKNGSTVPVAINSLSQADQEFIKQSMAANTGGNSEKNWTMFRGPDNSGISPDTGLLKSWPGSGPEQLWIFKDAGMGYSGFAIVDGRLYTMGTKNENEVHMVCIDTSSGSEVWSQAFATDDSQGYNAGWGNGPRGTPTFSEGKLYGLGPKGVIACLDAESGKVLWKKDLQSDFGGQAGGWGFSESPLVDGNKVVVAPGGNQSGIVALDKNSGQVIWKAEEVKPGKAEYATILATDLNGVRQYIKFFEKSLVSVDAEDGKLLWEGEFPKGRTAVIPTPIIDGDQVYVAAGYGAGCRAFKIKEDNSVELLWENNDMVNHHGGVIKFGDHLYGFSDGKGLVCQDWETGETAWMEKERQFLAKGAVHIADGMIYALNEQNGALTLVEANPSGYREKGRFVIEPQSELRNPRGKIWTHPVVIGGKLYLRDQEMVYCYDVKG